jgi:CheY-like chemotaxis protein
MTEEKKGDRILIVDDTLQNIQVLGTVLREQQYQGK